jgi:urease beta subunit
MRLHIAAGTAVRFEPGEAKEVLLVPFGGERQVHGFNNLVKGETETGNGHALLKKLNELQFKHTEA